MTDTPAKRKGRPAKYCPDLAAVICRAIADGEPIRHACAAHRVSWTTVYAWVHAHPEFADMLERARIAATERMADEVLTIADDASNDFVKYQTRDGNVRLLPNHAAVHRDRLRCESRRWLMQKWNPAKYGDRNRLELTGAGGGPILLEQLTLVAMERLQAERAAAAINGPSVIDDAEGALRLTYHKPK